MLDFLYTLEMTLVMRELIYVEILIHYRKDFLLKFFIGMGIRNDRLCSQEKIRGPINKTKALTFDSIKKFGIVI